MKRPGPLELIADFGEKVAAKDACVWGEDESAPSEVCMGTKEL